MGSWRHEKKKKQLVKLFLYFYLSPTQERKYFCQRIIIETHIYLFSFIQNLTHHSTHVSNTTYAYKQVWSPVLMLCPKSPTHCAFAMALTISCPLLYYSWPDCRNWWAEVGLIHLCPISFQPHCHPPVFFLSFKKLNFRIKGSITRNLTWLRRISVQLSKKPLSKLRGWKPAVYLSHDPQHPLRGSWQV